MKIIIYECRDPTELPDLVTGKGAERRVIGKGLFIGRIRCAMPGQGGKTVEGWHPVLFEAPTAEEVRRKLETWWAAEVAKAHDGRKGPRKAMERAPGPEAAPEVEVVEEAV